MTIIGHDRQIGEFIAELNGERLHHAWLLVGPEGIGKASIAIALAKRALSDAAGPKRQGSGIDVPVDHPIGRLVDNFSHPDFFLLEKLPKDPKQTRDIGRADWPEDLERARSITVDQVRGLGHLFAMKPSYSTRRVVVVDSVDDLERSGANALLKSLEEPPQGTIFLLVSHSPGRLLPTIRSRCRSLRFAGLDDREMLQILRARLPKLDEGELGALVSAGQGSPGKALGFVGLDIASLDVAFKKLAATGDPSASLRHELAKSLSLKSAHGRYEAFLDRIPSFIAAEAKKRTGDAIAPAIKSWEEVRNLSESAVRLSLDPAMTVFSLAGMIASLAE